MLYQLQNQIAQTIKEIYTESKIPELLKVSANSHNKIVHALVQQAVKRDLLHKARIHQLKNKSHIRIWLFLLALFFNSAFLIISILKYSLIPLLYRLIVKDPSGPHQKSYSLNLVFLNSAGGIDRLVDVIRGSFKKEKYVMYYLFTRFPRRIYERSKKGQSARFIQPHMPGKKAISGCLKFLFNNGQHFTSLLLSNFRHYPLHIRIHVVSDIIQYIYSLIIYSHWAKKKAFELSNAHPKALFIFDLDEASKELMLSDSLNQIGQKTLLMQHGILTDAKRYIPTCLYMACTSEREKQSLVSVGVNEKRLFVTGQALQTISDSVIKSDKNRLSYPVLILAGVGPIWLQNLYVHMLKNSQYLKSNGPTYLRLHPAIRPKGKKLWKYSDNLIFTDMGETIGECIAKSHLIITYSIDALTVSVRQHRPTIVCIPGSFFVPEWHNFMLSLPLVKVVKTSMLLDEALMDMDFRNREKSHFSEEQWQYVDYAFGDLNTKNNLKNLLSKLSTEPVPHGLKT